VQIIESSCLGVRAARFRLCSPASPVSVTLFPMLHIGEPAFYKAVYADAFSHDVVLAEGVNSPVGWHLTRSYRWISQSRLGLIVQPPYPAPEAVRAKIIRADLTPAEFEVQWGKIPLRLRLLCFFLAPIVGLRLRWFGTRESIAAHAEFEDLQSRRELLFWNPDAALFLHSIGGARDARIIEHLANELDRPVSEPRRLAAVYGAFHIRAVLAELRRRGFHVVEARWETVFAL
jgi:hypothetical protein